MFHDMLLLVLMQIGRMQLQRIRMVVLVLVMMMMLRIQADHVDVQIATGRLLRNGRAAAVVGGAGAVAVVAGVGKSLLLRLLLLLRSQGDVAAVVAARNRTVALQMHGRWRDDGRRRPVGRLRGRTAGALALGALVGPVRGGHNERVGGCVVGGGLSAVAVAGGKEQRLAMLLGG